MCFLCVVVRDSNISWLTLGTWSRRKTWVLASPRVWHADINGHLGTSASSSGKWRAAPTPQDPSDEWRQWCRKMLHKWCIKNAYTHPFDKVSQRLVGEATYFGLRWGISRALALRSRRPFNVLCSIFFFFFGWRVFTTIMNYFLLMSQKLFQLSLKCFNLAKKLETDHINQSRDSLS